MKRTRVVSRVLSAWVGLCMSAACGIACADVYPQTESVVRTSAELMERHFVSEVVGRRTADEIRRRLAAGEYATIESASQLERRLTDDLRSISGDKHVGVVFDRQSVARYRTRQAAQGNSNAKTEDEANKKAAIAESLRDNFGIRAIEILPGSVGYFRLDYFDGHVGESAPVFDAAMNLLAGSNAIILDLRQNGGGNSKLMPMFLSYFLGPGPVHFATRVERWKDESKAIFTLGEAGGPQHHAKSLYILTSGTTFSLAEQVTYHLKAFGRATVIGERTYGGGNGFDPVVLNDDFFMRLPRVAFLNAITGTSFIEGQGIAPDIAVSSADAKKRAYVEALLNLKDVVKDAELQREIAWAIPVATARLNANTSQDRKHESQFSGRFDNLVFEARHDGLWLSYQGLPFVRLERIGPRMYLDERAIQRQFEFLKNDSMLSPGLLLTRYGEAPVRVMRSK